jgi:broad specificity phosphatase PhoE
MITIPYDVVVCSSAPRAEQTAQLAIPLDDNAYWFIGLGRQFYCPASDEDFTEIWRMVAELGQVSYGDFLDHDSKGVFGRFRQECLDVIRTIPGITEARRIVFFNHAVMGNALAAALFPQHAAALRDIILAPCDGLRLTATTCEHFPLQAVSS